MKKRHPLSVFFLPFLTFGIYGIVWYVSTKEEMVKRGADIPTAWLLIIPFVNLYWLWKYSKGVAFVTNNRRSAGGTFALLLFLGIIGMAIIQSAFNKID